MHTCNIYGRTAPEDAQSLCIQQQRFATGLQLVGWAGSRCAQDILRVCLEILVGEADYRALSRHTQAQSMAMR
jgi:hypothetical protein